ncbi:SusC/RagA family TonB-linked outer membrane protein [Chitinophaga sp. XS-30]|uniref:SusC/RagA family TonB-linked outer membrane protein n=1 Tax=Chitinophaga sp. XS-30 TaxID=2604421 RepID=UPI0011DCCF35|nr:SusC/RagA family TonB-linked outer membrane protein [Chitinophaga sp. XS-30]QEH42576.1 SusC/RagA family TonB-linked outer membrane protein [Chitinophaga sp. XS-30]
MKRFYHLIVTCCLLLPQLLFAQQRTVSGKVTASENDAPLPGVTVQVKGTSTGTTTDASGNYRITVNSADAIIVFSYVGYLTKELPSGAGTLNVQLELDTRNLEGVVVTALGIRREKRALGYAVQDVSGEELVTARQSNVVNALQGKVAGVQISAGGGAPGQGASIVIRGINSLDAGRSAQALFVIDGVPMDNSTYTTGDPNSIRGMGNRASDINPDDIESISILRGGAATALYGLRAAGGAVVITTKSGKAGQVRISYTSSYGIDEVNKFPDVQSTYTQGFKGVYDPVNFWPTWGPTVDEARQLDPDHPAKLFHHYKRGYEQGSQFRNSINLSGGTEKALFAASFSQFNQDGVMPFSDYKNYSARVNGELRFSPQFRLNATLNYINSGGLRANADRFNEQLTYWAPAHDVKDFLKPDGTMLSYGTTSNPIYGLYSNQFEDNVNRIIASTNFVYSPVSWLDINYRIGADWYNDARTHTAPGRLGVPDELVYGDNRFGFINEYNLNNRILNSTLMLNFKNKITSKLHSDLKVGHDLYDNKLKRTSTTGDTLDIPTLFVLQNAKLVRGSQYLEDYRIIGLFGDWTLSWDDWLYLSLTGRNDWSSSLPMENRSFFYPSASLGYIFSEHLKTSWLDYGKLRASWARIGKDAQPYKTAAGYGTLATPIGSVIGWTRQDLLGDPNLKPEFTTSFETGVELKFLKNRIGVDFTWYTSKSKDLLIPVYLPLPSGSEQFYTNAGSIGNKGVELSLNGTPVSTRNFSWDVRVNYSANRNKVLAIREGMDEIVVNTHFGYTGSTATQKYIVGYPAGAIFGSHYSRYFGSDRDESIMIDHSRPLLIAQTGDLRGFPVYNAGQKYLGNGLPKWIGSITNNLRYKQFNLSFMFDTRQGVEKYNQFSNFMAAFGIAKFTENRNTVTTFNGVFADGTPNNIPVYLGQDIHEGRNYNEGYYRTVYRRVTENFVEDASWIRLRNVSLSYSLPSALVSGTGFLRDVTLTLTGNNLWLSTKYTGYDPESSSFSASSNTVAFAGFTYPAVRSYLATLNVSF